MSGSELKKQQRAAEVAGNLNLMKQMQKQSRLARLEKLVEDKNADPWVIGDLLVKLFPEGEKKGVSLLKWCTDHGIRSDHLRQCRKLALLFPDRESRTKYGLSWSHYRATLGVDNRHTWLQRAADENWNVVKLAQEIHGQKPVGCALDGKPIPESGGWSVSQGKKNRKRFCSAGCAALYLTRIADSESGVS